jgi:hypothetical protein
MEEKAETKSASLLGLRSSFGPKLDKYRLEGQQAGVLGVLNPRSIFHADMSLPSRALSGSLE